MNVPKTIRQIYRDQAGKDAERSCGLDNSSELAVYIEAPTRDYIDWLEKLATKGLGKVIITQPDSAPLSVVEEVLRGRWKWKLTEIEIDVIMDAIRARKG